MQGGAAMRYTLGDNLRVVRHQCRPTSLATTHVDTEAEMRFGLV